MLKPSIVREFFNYDAETGLLTWRIRRANCIKTGDRAGYLKADGYLIVGVCWKLQLVHRVAWVHYYGAEAPKYIDHINGNRSDNRIANLRAATPKQNVQNIKKAYSTNKSSGVLGVYWHQCGKWQARIQTDGRSKSLGLFATKEEAHQAYLKAKREFHEFCTI